MMKKGLFILFLFFSLTGFSQSKGFPDSWVGYWKGALQWFKTGNADPQKVNMELRIMPGDSTGVYPWQIIYGSVTEDNRPYLLKAIDAAKGHWVIDELNGIVLDQFWVGNKFCGAFTIKTSTIVNNYWLEKGKLIVEFYSLGAKPLATTGKGTEESPNVDSYRIGSYQKAILTRQK